jgi:hypothetical protein
VANMNRPVSVDKRRRNGKALWIFEGHLKCRLKISAIKFHILLLISELNQYQHNTKFET